MAIDFLAPARLGVRLTAGLLRLEARVLEELLDLLAPERADDPVSVDAEPPMRENTPAPEPEPEPLRAEAPDVSVEPEAAPPPLVEPEPLSPSIEEPRHLDVEPELVAESADAGAEDGAGAEVHIDEPWNG